MRDSVKLGLMMAVVFGAIILVLVFTPTYSSGDSVPFNKTSGFCEAPRGCQVSHSLGDDFCIIQRGCN